MAEYRMPSLGADMTKGKLLEWRVKPGDTVKRGDIIALIETDKADIEAEVYETGVVEELVAKAGEELPVGALMARIGGVETARPPRIHASPLARRMAEKLGVDLARVKGSGPGGEIQAKDIEPAAPQPVGAEEAGLRMRRAIAAAMSRSNREIPHYYLETRISMARAMDWLARENAKRPLAGRLLPVVLLIKAVAKALVDVPDLNAYWIDGRAQRQDSIHVGFAISLRQGGLVIPAIQDADLKTPDELMAVLRDLIPRARAGNLRGAEVTSGTITLTSLGELGVDAVYGVIYPPQVALVGFGRIGEHVWAENGMIGARPAVIATLAGDHRATDGHRGAQFLDAVDRHLQEPDKL
ncbi:MAG: dihydrolipoamide acetyltransferase family protein [Bryobacteraceae bacterium]|nr:dihydrolipoamide acetyltransferase family protein [Bryobacteraceae bacterium]